MTTPRSRVIPLIALLCVAPAIAQAEIRFSGEFSMGLRFDSDASDRWALTSGQRLTMHLQRTTDGGITFGARINLLGMADGEEPTGFMFVQTRNTTLAFGNIRGDDRFFPGLHGQGSGF